MAAQSQEFYIGDLDLRLSTDLTKAGELSPVDSVGVMTECTLTMTTNETKLQAGFPQRTYASAVTSRDLEVSGSLSEYTVSNMAMLYGDAAAMVRAATATGAKSDITTAVVAAATDIVVTDSSHFAADDYIYVYAAGDATDVYAAQVASVDNGTNTITVTYGIPRAFAVGDFVVKGEAIILGADTAIPPMTVQVVGVMPLDGQPFVYDVWKATISGTVEVKTATDAFGTLPYTISPLTPSAQEITCGAYGADAAKQAVIKKFVQGRLTKGYASASC